MHIDNAPQDRRSYHHCSRTPPSLKQLDPTRAPGTDDAIRHRAWATDERQNEDAWIDDRPDHAAPRRSCRSASDPTPSPPMKARLCQRSGSGW
jgi:hypothetical protein